MYSFIFLSVIEHLVIFFKLILFFLGEEEDAGNFTAVSPTSIPGNVLEQIIEQSAYKNLEDNKRTIKANSNRSHQNNLIFFNASATSLAHKAEAINI